MDDPAPARRVADVASYDPPGIGDEPPAGEWSRQSVVRGGLAEVESRGWQRFFVLADGWAVASAVHIASELPQAMQGVVLGHAKLSYRREAERAPVTGVWGR